MHEEQVFYFFYKISTIATPHTSANFNESTSSFSLQEIMRNLIARALADHDTITTGHATAQSSKKSNCLSFSSHRKQVQEVNSKSSFKVLRDKLKLIQSLETSVQETSLRIAGVTAHSVSEFLRGKKSDVCSVHMYNYNACTIRMLRALWSYTELSLTNHSACLTLAIL